MNESERAAAQEATDRAMLWDERFGEPNPFQAVADPFAECKRCGEQWMDCVCAWTWKPE